MPLDVGTHVLVKGEHGVLKFVGKTEFAGGIWYGIELDKIKGKNDGSVNGVKYFECSKKNGNYGVFVRRDIVTESEAKQASPATGGVASKSAHMQKTEEQLANSRLQIDQLEKQLEKVQKRLQSIESDQEQTTVDKIYFEERNAKLIEQLEEISLKYEEIKVDYQILQEENQLSKHLEEEARLDLSDGPMTRDQMHHVITHSKKLEVALSNLKETYSNKEKNYTETIDRLETSISGIASSVNDSSQFQAKLAEKDALVESLRSQLDSSFESEKIIEHLNIENQSLNSRIAELVKAVEELTEIHELDKSLEESQAAVEAELRSQIADLQKMNKRDKSAIAELDRRYKHMQEMIENYKDVPGTGKNSPSDAENLRQQIETLNVDIRKLQLDKYTSDVEIGNFKSKETVYQFLQNLLETVHMQHRPVLTTVMSIKKVQASSEEILNISFMDVDLLPLPLSSKLEMRFCSKILNQTLSSLLVLYEHNYESKALRDHERSFSKHTLTLNDYLQSTIEGLKNGVYDGFDKQMFESTISSCLDLLKSSNSDCQFYREKSYGLCISKNAMFESILGEEILRDMKRLISAKGFVSSSESESILSSFEGVRSTINIVKDSAKRNVTEISGLSSNFDISIKNTEILDASYIVGGIFYVLSQHLKQLEKSGIAETKILDENLSHEENEELYLVDENRKEIIVNNLRDLSNRFSEGISLILEPKEVNCIDIYHALGTKEVEKHGEGVSFHDKFEELNIKLLEKDRVIDELNHNVLLLEQNYSSLSESSSKTISNLKTEVSTLQTESQKMRETFDEQVTASKKMEEELNSMRETASLFDGNYSVGKFDDMLSEKKFGEMITTLDLLTNIKSMIDESFRPKFLSDNNWLQKKVSQEQNLGFNKETKLFSPAIRLRDIVMGTKMSSPIKLEKNWRPLAQHPKYQLLVLNEQLKGYESLKRNMR